MNKNKEAVLKEKARKTSIKEASSYALMDGFGLRYVTPYALALGASKLQIGLISSLPSLIGNFFQIFTPLLMENHKRKKIISTSVFYQALMWLVLVLIGAGFFYLKWTSSISSSLLVIGYTILILVGSISGPAWTSWMRDLTDDIKSGEYFGIRNRISGTISLICMFIGGFALDYFKEFNIFLGFAIIFVLAFVGRAGSAYLFTKQYEPKWKKKEGYYFSLLDFLKIIHKNNYGRFVLTTALMAFSVTFAAPYFQVYMLQNLHFSYIEYTSVIISATILTLIMLPKWGRFADKYGNIKVIKITGILISITPLIWLASSFFGGSLPFIVLIIAEIVGGFAWAGYNLSVGNFIYDAVTKQRMALCSAYFGIVHGVFAFVGAMLGALVSSLDIHLLGLSAVLLVFLISSILRIISLYLIRKNVKEVRAVKSLKGKKAKEEFKSLVSFDLNDIPGSELVRNKAY
jgi:MFS family permease